jgi:hypothetical protein
VHDHFQAKLCKKVKFSSDERFVAFIKNILNSLNMFMLTLFEVSTMV